MGASTLPDPDLAPDPDRTCFHCATCHQVTRHDHYDLWGVSGQRSVELKGSWAVACCRVCKTVVLFYGRDQVIPPRLRGDFDAPDLPGEIVAEICCARATLCESKRASAAHARTALYAMLRDTAIRRGLDPTLPPDALFAGVVPAAETTMHALFAESCLRGGALIPAGVLAPQEEPEGTANSLLWLVDMAHTLLY